MSIRILATLVLTGAVVNAAHAGIVALTRIMPLDRASEGLTHSAMRPAAVGVNVPADLIVERRRDERAEAVLAVPAGL